MSETPDMFDPPPPPEAAKNEAHVERVRDVTRDRKLVLPASPNSETGWRQAHPITYDIALHAPTDEVDTAQEK
jgi:hypothetical protein